MIGLHCHGHDLCGMPMGMNCVCHMNLVEGKCDYRKVIDNPRANDRLFHYVREHNGNYYYVPFFESRLLIWNYENKKKRVIDLHLDDRYEQAGVGKFYNIAFYRKKAYLIPFGYQAIVSIDLENGKVDHYMDMRSEFQGGKGFLFSRYVHTNEYQILLPSLMSNHVITANLQAGTYERDSIGNQQYRFSGVVKSANSMWFILKNDLCIIEKDLTTNEEKEYRDFPDGCKPDERHCFDDKAIVLYGKYIYCFPAGSNKAVRFHTEEKIFEELTEFQKYCENKKINRRYSIFNGCAQNGSEIYLNYQLGTVIRYNLRTGEIAEYEKSAKHLGMWIIGDIPQSAVRESKEACGAKIHRMAI